MKDETRRQMIEQEDRMTGSIIKNLPISLSSCSLYLLPALSFCFFTLSACSDPHKTAGTPDGASSHPSPSVAGSTPVDVPPTIKAGACVPQAGGRDFEVGPGAKYEHVIDVPWETLGPGDSVRIHYVPGGYHEKVLLSQSGSEKSPLVVCGIAGPKGERPILDGDAAKTRDKAKLAYAFDPQQQRGVFIVSLDHSDRYGFKPSHVVIQGLEFKHAHPDYHFTASAGEDLQYLPPAAGLFIERGEDIVVRDCVIDDNANGFFVASGDDEATQSRNITLEASYVFGNGTTGKGFDRHHNAYSEAIGMVYQFNRFGPEREGAGGSALKDRSAGPIVRYNWIEGGSRSLDLVEAEDGWNNEKSAPHYDDAWAYGNVIVAGSEGASNVVHFGGDNGVEDKYKKGTLYFYDNTVVIRADQTKRWRTSLFELATNDQTVDARNNVVFVTSATAGAAPTSLTLMNQSGTGRFGKNVMSPFDPFAEGRAIKGKVEGADGIVKLASGASPFRDIAALDLRPGEGSPAIGAGEALASGALPVDREYVPHLDSKPRVPNDIGAFEH
jgi:hypothetical protein